MQFKITPKQYDFIGAYEQFMAYIAAVGCGKTTALISKGMFHSEESPNNLGVIVRKNFTDLRDSTMKDFRDYTGLEINESRKDAVLPNGSTIMFRHGDELPVLKNINLGWFAIEQAEEFPDDNVWQFLKMRLRRQSKFRTGFMIANTNGHNWVWKLFKENGTPDNHRLIECNTYEHRDALRKLGEANALQDDYMRTLETLPKKLFNRFVMNSWEEAEGLVYDEFLEARDVMEPFAIPEHWQQEIGLDHGLRNPTAVLWYAIDHDGNIIVYNEHYEAEKPISYHAEMIKRKGTLTSGIADPSIFSINQQKNGYVFSIGDEYRDFGIMLRPAFRSKEEASIARVNEMFKAGRIKIFKNCVNLIREIENWKWKDVKPGVVLNKPEEPEDRDNHACDVLKYIVATRYQATPKLKEAIQPNTAAWYMEQKKNAKNQVHHYTGSRMRFSR